MANDGKKAGSGPLDVPVLGDASTIPQTPVSELQAQKAKNKLAKKELAVPVACLVTKGTITQRDTDGEDVIFEVGDTVTMSRGEAIEKRGLGLVSFDDPT